MKLYTAGMLMASNRSDTGRDGRSRLLPNSSIERGVQQMNHTSASPTRYLLTSQRFKLTGRERQNRSIVPCSRPVAYTPAIMARKGPPRNITPRPFALYQFHCPRAASRREGRKLIPRNAPRLARASRRLSRSSFHTYGIHDLMICPPGVCGSETTGRMPVPPGSDSAPPRQSRPHGVADPPRNRPGP